MNVRNAYAPRWIAMAALASALFGCAAAPSSPVGGFDTSRAAPAAVAMESPAHEASAASADPNQTQARLIIRSADLTLIVKDTQAGLDAIGAIARDHGGFIVSSSTSRVGDELQGQVTLRVEATQFSQALEQVRALAVEVRDESVRGEDVTAEFVDLEAQLKNLEATEAQLQQILKQAVKTEDVLSVYRELTTIRGQIEQIKGRAKYLSQSAALATISVALIPDALAQPVDAGGWRPEGVAKAALEALIAGLQSLANTAIWFTIAILPLLLILAIPVAVIVVLVRRQRRARKTAA